MLKHSFGGLFLTLLLPGILSGWIPASVAAGKSALVAPNHNSDLHVAQSPAGTSRQSLPVLTPLTPGKAKQAPAMVPPGTSPGGTLPSLSQAPVPLPPVPTPAATPILPVPASGNVAKAEENDDLDTSEARIFDQSSILISKPQLKALISVSEGLNPLALDASASQAITLRQALTNALANNLQIGISRENVESQRWTYRSNLARFLPDIPLNMYYIYLLGRFALPGSPVPVNFHNPLLVLSPSIRFGLFRGGEVLFSSRQSRYNYRAALSAGQATLSDVLLDVARRYYDLVLNEAILQIRIKAVETSEAQLAQNTNLHEDGLATYLDVLQARTQLARDRQALLEQQVTRRNSAIQLAHAANMSMTCDLAPEASVVSKVPLLARQMKINDLLKAAIEHRPELKRYEELRLSAREAIGVATAPLLPKVQLVNYLFALKQSGHTSAAAGPAAGAPGGASGSAVPAGATATATGANEFSTLYAFGVNATWNFNNLGLRDAANIQTARANARQAHLQANQELVDVIEQVRTSYINSLSAEKRIEQSSDEVTSSREALRLARLRFQNGLGTNLDIIQAQRDYTQALISKAQAIVNFNTSQVQLLRDTGLISVDNLTANQPLLPQFK